MNQILYLFPDTNFFIQCKVFPELNWKEFKGYAEVHLIVCRPVQREINAQKNRGNDRVGRRARKTYTMFRDLARGVASFNTINKTAPQVKVFLEAMSQPSSQLAEQLDYTKPDDELVGFLHRYQQEHPERVVGLLTDDSGPMMTAKALGLRVYPIDKSWVLPPEANRHEREINELKQLIAELENAGPKFSIQCIDSKGEETELLELEHIWYEPLTSEQVEELINELKVAFPIAKEFGPSQPMVDWGTIVPGRKVDTFSQYIPASENEIQKYTHQEYPQWIEDCRESFATLHEELQVRIPLPSFSFTVSNDGMRPGDNVLVVLECKGNLDIQPLSRDSLEHLDGSEEQAVRLPKPPKPPKGEWTSRVSHIRRSQVLTLGNHLTGMNLDIPLVTGFVPEVDRDAEGFYYKSSRPREPVKQFSLECKLWRHGITTKSFGGEIVLDSSARSARGILECTIHAENLPFPARKTVKIEVLAKNIGMMDAAKGLIRQMEEGNGG